MTTSITILRIQNVYENINNEFISGKFFGEVNTKDFRKLFRKILEYEFSDDILVKCDEENNPSSVIEMNCLVAKISWIKNFEMKYCNLVFGRVEQAYTIHQTLN